MKYKKSLYIRKINFFSEYYHEWKFTYRNSTSQRVKQWFPSKSASKKRLEVTCVTALTHRYDGGHEEAETIYVLGNEEEPSEK